MLGLGETEAELLTALADIRAARLRPAHDRPVPAAERRAPAGRALGDASEEFDAWAGEARGWAFAEVFSGPLVRSSYRAEKLAAATLG